MRDYYYERRQELIGNRRRKLYRGSRALRDWLQSRRVEGAMRSAVRRLERLWA